MVVAAGEKWAPSEKFSKNTANCPDVDGLVYKVEYDSWRKGHKKLAFVYILNDSMISGARYHRVATYSVMSPVSLPSADCCFTLLARPKSQTLRSQLALSRRLAGFKSRCTMSALWIDLSARRV